MIPKLKIGVVGLGRAFALMLPTFAADTRVELAGGADPRPEARSKFSADVGAPAFASVEELCARCPADVVYVATPHQHHAEHAIAAAQAGKHVLVEKPIALALEDCQRMIAAARKNGVHLIVGHSHSFDAPIRHARALISSGAFGTVRMVSTWNYTDFLYRPRRPEELDTAAGGGVVFNQAAHQVDVARLLAGCAVKRVRAHTLAWDPARPTDGAYAALLGFDGGGVASLVYSGYAHFDSDEWMGWIGELGGRKDPQAYRGRATPAGDELALKNARNYGGEAFRAQPTPDAHQHFGPVIVSCERGDVRPLPDGVLVYADGERRLEPLPAPQVPRTEVIDEVYDAVMYDRLPLHNGEWAMATLEVCLAMLRSSREQREILL